MTHARLSLAALMAVLPLGLALTLNPARGEDATLIARALAAAGARDWAGADAAAARSGPLAVDLVLWQRLRAGQGSWPEYRDFARRNPAITEIDAVTDQLLEAVGVRHDQLS